MSNENALSKNGYVEEIIEQLTRKKLEYTRQLLRDAELPHTGKRADIRKRLPQAIADGAVEIEKLSALLKELDTWGQQRIRIGHIRLYQRFS